LRLYWSKKLKSRYYNSIEELPVLNWWKLHEEDNLNWLLKNPNKKVNIYAAGILKEIKAEFVDVFGIDDRYEKYIDKIRELALVNIELSLGGAKSLKNKANMLEIDLEDLLSKEEKKVYNHGVMGIEKYLGFPINEEKITVYTFYSYIKEIEKQVKIMRSNG
jgi:hypothetical protein